MILTILEEISDVSLPNVLSELQEISLQNNKLSTLPKFVFYSRYLRTIRLNNNNISWDNLSKLSQSIPIEKFAEEIDYSDPFRSIHFLRDLDLSNNSIESISIGSKDDTDLELFLNVLIVII